MTSYNQHFSDDAILNAVVMDAIGGWIEVVYEKNSSFMEHPNRWKKSLRLGQFSIQWSNVHVN